MSRDEKERRVIDLYYNQGKTTREIIKELRVSPNYVSAILKKEEEKNNSIVTNKQQQPSSSLATRAYELFSNGKTPLQIAIALNIRQSEAAKYYREYWKLKGLDKLNIIHKETNGNTWPLWKLYKQLVKKSGMSIAQVVNVVEIAIHKLPHMETLYKQLKDEVDKLQYIRQGLLNDIAALKYKILILDKTAFSIEQDFKRKEQ
jgi:DNA-binding CsgD family transcriptional regulator